MTILIDNFEQHYLLGIDKMDETHKAFTTLVNCLGMASKEEFKTRFPELVSHTLEHFEQEKQWMEASGFSATHEHLDEHQRILGELDRFAQRVSAGFVAMGRAYVAQQLPQWFDIHAKTMDSALAAHLKSFSLDSIER